ncbi:MAG: bifunctional (p)ppGpp synthetase/guanosine-3',5'-bis(diphosphate) 3'-pyrophosphohydrolase [Chlorobi bacterium]|nr:bifunctional (p)ppGpp synthetase/guanosine-3',5'-bis(diphosphate) 3'-pyrophosphohydrolase [Chlorobiota bacterium]
MSVRHTATDELNRQVKNKYRSFLHLLRTYYNEVDQKKVRRALRNVMANSGEISGQTGEPYIFHALNVSRIVIEQIGLGPTSAIAAVYHDLTETGSIKDEWLKQDGASQVMELLEGLGKISGIKITRVADASENFRRLILNLAGDVRVVLIRLAEQLELMRHLDFQKPEDQVAMATDSYYLYAPLAHRLGLYNIKSELEDLSLKYLEPDVYRDLQKKISETKRKRNRYIREFIDPLKEKLTADGFRYQIKSRLKSVHSIWEKIQVQGISFEEIYDLFAVRIIIESPPEKEKENCWRVYSIVTDVYMPNPSRLRDWISIPKSNGYESLHTTVVGPGGHWVEVQIRTKRMDEIAEQGFAAHWKYKGGREDEGLDQWLKNVREILEDTDAASDDVIDQVKLNLYSNEIFVFTPRGDVIRLPENATLLDFAFAIHSDVGLRCTGGRVNDKAVPLHHRLQTGDRVEVTTAKNQKPATGWLRYVVTSKAKSKIKQSLDEEKTKAAREGRELLMRRIRNWKIPFSDESLKKIMRHFKLKAAKDLYALVFDGKIDPLEIKEILTNKPEDLKERTGPVEGKKLFSLEEIARNEDFLIIDKKMKSVDYKLARCCNPIFGDPVFGFVTIREGIKIHRKDCPNAKSLMSRYPYRIVPAKWTDIRGNLSFEAAIRVSGEDDMGIVNRITELISNDLRVNMRSIRFQTGKGVYEGVIKLFVTNANHLEIIIRKIRKIKGVHKVSRFYDLGDGE